jgi:hypothetical protein
MMKGTRIRWSFSQAKGWILLITSNVSKKYSGKPAKPCIFQKILKENGNPTIIQIGKIYIFFKKNKSLKLAKNTKKAQLNTKIAENAMFSLN